MKALTVHKRKSLTVHPRLYRTFTPIYPARPETRSAFFNPSLRGVVSLAVWLRSVLISRSWGRPKGSAAQGDPTTVPPKPLRQPAREIMDTLLLRGF